MQKITRVNVCYVEFFLPPMSVNVIYSTMNIIYNFNSARLGTVLMLERRCFWYVQYCTCSWSTIQSNSCSFNIPHEAIVYWRYVHVYKLIYDLPLLWRANMSSLSSAFCSKSLCTRRVSWKEAVKRRLDEKVHCITESLRKGRSYLYHGITGCWIIQLCIRNYALSHIQITSLVDVYMTDSIYKYTIK